MSKYMCPGGGISRQFPSSSFLTSDSKAWQEPPSVLVWLSFLHLELGFSCIFTAPLKGQKRLLLIALGVTHFFSNWPLSFREPLTENMGAPTSTMKCVDPPPAHTLFEMF